MAKDSSKKSYDLCAIKDMQILDLLHNTIMLHKTIVELREKARSKIESKDRVTEGMSK